MKPGWSTNSIGCDPLEAIGPLAAMGYRSLAITPDLHLLDPSAPNHAGEVTRWREGLARHGMACVIETGGRYLLDPCRKHEPTLLSSDAAGRGRRVAFLLAAIDLAAELAAGCVSLWSGVVHDAADEETLLARLAAGLDPVLEHAARRGVVLGFEPEPGMFIDTLDRCSRLFDRLGRPADLGVTIDIGHLECLGERPLPQRINAAGRIVNVHLDDMLCCRHEHLPLGLGEIDFPPVITALAQAGYRGGLHAELPRQAHRWHTTARETADFLARLLPAG